MAWCGMAWLGKSGVILWQYTSFFHSFIFNFWSLSHLCLCLFLYLSVLSIFFCYIEVQSRPQARRSVRSVLLSAALDGYILNSMECRNETEDRIRNTEILYTCIWIIEVGVLIHSTYFTYDVARLWQIKWKQEIYERTKIKYHNVNTENEQSEKLETHVSCHFAWIKGNVNTIFVVRVLSMLRWVFPANTRKMGISCYFCKCLSLVGGRNSDAFSENIFGCFNDSNRVWELLIDVALHWERKQLSHSSSYKNVRANVSSCVIWAEIQLWLLLFDSSTSLLGSTIKLNKMATQNVFAVKYEPFLYKYVYEHIRITHIYYMLKENHFNLAIFTLCSLHSFKCTRNRKHVK